MKTLDYYRDSMTIKREAQLALVEHAKFTPRQMTLIKFSAKWYRAYVIVETNDRVLTEEEATKKLKHEAEIKRVASETGCTVSFDGDVRGILIRVHPRDKFSDNPGGGIGLI